MTKFQTCASYELYHNPSSSAPLIKRPDTFHADLVLKSLPSQRPAGQPLPSRAQPTLQKNSTGRLLSRAWNRSSSTVLISIWAESMMILYRRNNPPALTSLQKKMRKRWD